MTFRPRCRIGTTRFRCLGAGVLLAALLLLTSCGPPERRADVVIINGANPQTLDPALATGIEDLRIVSALFEGLARTDPVTAAPIPGLAEKWEISPDGLTYTFHLRPNLWWSKDAPITADDIVY